MKTITTVSSKNVISLIESEIGLIKSISSPVDPRIDNQFWYLIFEPHFDLNDIPVKRLNQVSRDEIALLFELSFKQKTEEIELEKLQKSPSALENNQVDLRGEIRKESIRAILISENILEMRLNALAKKQLVKSALHIDLPIFIQDDEGEILDYHLEWQQRDLRETLENDNFTQYIRLLARSCNILNVFPVEEVVKRFANSASVKENYELNLTLFPHIAFAYYKNYNALQRLIKNNLIWEESFNEYAKGLLDEAIEKKDSKACLDILGLMKDLSCIYTQEVEYITRKDFLSWPAGAQSYPYEKRQTNLLLHALESSCSSEVILFILKKSPQLIRSLTPVIQIYRQYDNSNCDDSDDDSSDCYNMGYSDGTGSLYKVNYCIKKIITNWQQFINDMPCVEIDKQYLSKELKRLTLDGVQEKISRVQNLESLMQLYENYKDSFIINVRRNPNLDRSIGFFSRKNDYTESKKHLLISLQQRAVGISQGLSRDIISELLSSELFSEQHIKHGVSDTFRQQLVKLLETREKAVISLKS